MIKDRSGSGVKIEHSTYVDLQNKVRAVLQGKACLENLHLAREAGLREPSVGFRVQGFVAKVEGLGDFFVFRRVATVDKHRAGEPAEPTYK